MRIAHCSDLHLFRFGQTRPSQFLNKRVLGGLNLLLKARRAHRAELFGAMIADFNRGVADHIVVTGDVTNLALDSEMRFAREMLDTIDGGPRAVTVLPGNHDAYVGDVDAFHRYMAPYFAADPDWCWPGDDPWPVVRVRRHVAIVAISTARRNSWLACDGEVGATQLERLGQVLSDPRLTGAYRVIAIHHPPAGPRARRPGRGLRDHARFAEVVALHGAELILHGHNHLSLVNRLPVPGDGVVAVRGIESGTSTSEKPRSRARYRIFEIAGGSEPPRLAGEESHTWNSKRRVFDDTANDNAG